MIANQPPTDLLQTALDHAYARGWHDGFVAGRQEESTRANERMPTVPSTTEYGVAVLVNALCFYAEEDNYTHDGIIEEDRASVSVMEDDGDCARAALARYAVDDEGETTK